MPRNNRMNNITNVPAVTMMAVHDNLARQMESVLKVVNCKNTVPEVNDRPAMRQRMDLHSVNSAKLCFSAALALIRKGGFYCTLLNNVILCHY